MVLAYNNFLYNSSIPMLLTKKKVAKKKSYNIDMFLDKPPLLAFAKLKEFKLITKNVLPRWQNIL